MANVKLSVIIPAYNVENSLRACVESVLMQGIENLEIIIINDGSTDATGVIAKGLEGAHGNVKVIHQNNEGLSAARNSGIDVAQGEYITFVDSDDWLIENTYPKLIKYLDEHLDCDILEYSFLRSDGRKVGSPLVFSDVTYDNSRDYWFMGHGYEHAYAWNKFFRRNIFFSEKGHLLRFEVGRIFEDVAFLATLLRMEPTITTTSLGSYVYFLNPQGLTSCATARGISQLLEVHLHLVDKYKLAGRCLTFEEEEYYMSVVNIQITLCQMSHRKPLLPTCNVTIRKGDFVNFPRFVKKIFLSFFGITALCQLFCRHRLK